MSVEGAMGSHDNYGKMVLRRAIDDIELDGPAVTISLGCGGTARIDGAIPGQIAVEVESRTSKQVRGAVLDLLLHSAPRKLLVLVPKHMQNPTACSVQSSAILGRFIQRQDYRVVLLEGTGDAHQLESDVATVRHAFAELRNV
jgi:hypothetical protein